MFLVSIRANPRDSAATKLFFGSRCVGKLSGTGGVWAVSIMSEGETAAYIAATARNCYLEAMASPARSVAIPLDLTLPAAAEEKGLVAELQAGSEEAFAYLLNLYRKSIYNVVLHMLGNEADAADVLQNVFVKIIRGIGQFHGESSLKTWVWRIAVHEASNYRRGWFRRRRRETCSLDETPPHPAVVAADGRVRGETPYDVMEQWEREETVKRALRSLAEPYRTVVILREIEGLPYDEIAEVLRLAEGTVKSRLLRGREILRRKLRSCL